MAVGAGGRRVASSVDELLAGASDPEPLPHTDGKSGAHLARVVIDGVPLVVKRLDLRSDWTMRAVGDLGCTTLTLWRSGFLDRLPGCFNQPIIAVAHEPASRPGGYGTVLLMRDVGTAMVPEGDDPIPLAQHRTFLAHLAELSAAFWGFTDDLGLIPLANRYLELSPWTAEIETARPDPPFVPRLIGRGWRALKALEPRAAGIVVPLFEDLDPLVDALATTPSTFVHGNWKLGNLGTDDEGRTVLIDWETPGAGPPCGELAWYLAINSARLPESKEATITAFRESLERAGVDTAPWWERQLAVSLLGGLVHFGWEKALGGDRDELGWWAEQAEGGARYLG